VRAPRQAGEAELARAAGEVADTVVAEWGRILRADEPPFEPVGGVHTWDPSVAPASPDAAAELAAPEPASAAAVLLAESRRLDLAGDPNGALDAALQAAALPVPGAAEAARLRAIQLAVRAGRTDVAREQWELVRGALSGAEILDGCSALLLCGLAAAPALTPEERAALAADLRARLEAGRLPLPESGGRLVLDAADPRAGKWDAPLADSFVARLGELAGDAADLAARHEDERTTAALRALLDEAGAPAPTGERWSVVPAGRGLLLFARRRDDGSLTAFLARGTTVRRGLQDGLAARGLIAEGFYVVFDNAEFRARDPTWAGLDARAEAPADPGASLAGVIVRDRTALVGEDLGFTVWHHDPAAFVTEESLRAGRTRAALLVMAAFTAVAAGFTARAMRRERQLAGLRTAFIASVSHELRTPVASILLLVENLESGRAGPGAPTRYHALLRREAHRLRRIVDDVLDMSRLERGRPVELRLDEVDMPAFAADLVDEARELVARTGSTLDVRLGSLPATAALDADAMRRAVPQPGRQRRQARRRRRHRARDRAAGGRRAAHRGRRPRPLACRPASGSVSSSPSHAGRPTAPACRARGSGCPSCRRSCAGTAARSWCVTATTGPAPCSRSSCRRAVWRRHERAHRDTHPDHRGRGAAARGPGRRAARRGLRDQRGG
jgi:signal transduction histidine kinase